MSIPCKIDPLGTREILPVGYTRLGYLKGNGQQYIDTGIYPDSDIGCRIEARPSQHIIYTQLAGAASSSSSNFFLPLYCYSNLTIGFSDRKGAKYPQRDGSDASSGDKAMAKGYQAVGRIKVDLNYLNSGRWVYLDETNTVIRNAEVSYMALRIFLFARNYDNMKPGDKYFYGWADPVYSARFSRGKKIIGNFMPALDAAGTPCMYDTVTDKTFYNAGTGAFIAGVETQHQLDDLLRNLPNRTGQKVGVLQLWLDASLQTVQNETKLDAMLEKNWEVSQAC